MKAYNSLKMFIKRRLCDMKMKKHVNLKAGCLLAGFALFSVFSAESPVFAGEEDILYTFDESIEGWKVPDWAFEQRDYVAGKTLLSGETMKSGPGALEVVCDFPGNRWAAALVEIEKDMDLSGYSSISADIFIPKSAPKGFFKARFIMTVGIGWHFIEMREPVDLIPGKWVTLQADIEKEELLISDWKGRGEKRLFKHADKVKKIAVRIEYDASPPHTIGGRYNGPVFIDNVVISK